jgi:UbiD family decarboxylase
MGVPQEPRIYKIVSNTLPRVKNVVLTEGGGCWLHAVVSIKKKVEGEGKNVGLAALAAHPSLKRVVVVDDDIDITNEKEVEWAIATRVQPDKDVIVIPGAKGSSLDPSQDYASKTTAKWIIDATAPIDRKEEFEKVRMEEFEKINPGDYL